MFRMAVTIKLVPIHLSERRMTLVDARIAVKLDISHYLDPCKQLLRMEASILSIGDFFSIEILSIPHIK